VPVSGLGVPGVVRAIAAGGEHSLALKSDGTVVAWGDNSSGQLGNGTATTGSLPVAVSGLSRVGVAAIAAGRDHSLALRSDGTVVAWGYNYSGQLGNGNTTESQVPVAVFGLSGAGVTAIAGGGDHSLALKSDGTVVAWGYNYSGQLGNNSAIDSHVPVSVVGLGGAGVTAIAGDVGTGVEPAG
jgi:alpha-tubulin suppressor-like RCC1 family protein